MYHLYGIRTCMYARMYKHIRVVRINRPLMFTKFFSSPLLNNHYVAFIQVATETFKAGNLQYCSIHYLIRLVISKLYNSY